MLKRPVFIENSPVGQDTPVRPGDILFAHRKGFISRVIGLGERIRFGDGHWSHCAFVETPDTLIEALAHGVVRTPLNDYREIEYKVVHTNLEPLDIAQAVAFAQSCIGQEYGFGIIFGIILRYLTPGRGLWFGMNGTEICSGLTAQAEVRGWANYPWNPASCSPTELWKYYERQSLPDAPTPQTS